MGLCVVTAAGLLSSALNFCYAFGAGALAQAREMGVSQLWISNVVAAPATSGGFVANCCYCTYLLRKNGSGFRFGLRQARWNWLHGTLMGAFWFGGLALYGVGVTRMGSFGTVVGWPLTDGNHYRDEQCRWDRDGRMEGSARERPRLSVWRHVDYPGRFMDSLAGANGVSAAALNTLGAT